MREMRYYFPDASNAAILHTDVSPIAEMFQKPTVCDSNWRLPLCIKPL
jgi:hypothetical protein